VLGVQKCDPPNRRDLQIPKNHGPQIQNVGGIEIMSQLLRDYNSLCRTTLGVFGVGRVSHMWTCSNIAKKTKASNRKQIKLRYNAIFIYLYIMSSKQHSVRAIIYDCYSLKYTTRLVFTVIIVG